ncbi:hydroxyproline-rich glycoprotein-like protein [Pochonia chlamydosporia 170]|uniref:Hydroxyproline-rich glycoprotein-like protein n=1 Tax=Pochonia chlamydosporia 170 TaxID=1380566 RepID=A0A179G5F8_METCM|nr:hydroxyproline-rich glycoprotein-like protein [Pochonia chlamydosporia 170]OAQ73057.1 hydroxyproline-rich glycoprotein-like protein [Pochonia chlamydosporia 170]
MGESAPSADGESSDGPPKPSKPHPHTDVINIIPTGDIILSVTFETSPEILKKTRKASLPASRSTSLPNGTSTPPQVLKPKVTIAYRVQLDMLKKHSKYFSNLLTNPQFREAKLIAAAHADLASMKMKPSQAEPMQLPRIKITDDDEATQSAGRELVFEDMLRIIHHVPIKTTRVIMSYVTTLALLADRFDCAAPVSKALVDMKFKWPLTNTRPYMDELGRVTETEKVLRQKILVAWLLEQPMRLHQATRELVIRGSRLWSAYGQEEDLQGAWWNLPEGIEEELQYRRECILNTVSSIQQHFLNLYSSRDRQCKLGYDSSTACDSFQFGQMLKFLMSKDLLFLVDFAPTSVDNIPDTSMIDIDELLGTLKQCPNYQVDKHHMNCGLRIRIEPILDYVRAMVGAGVVAIPLADWKRRRGDVSWMGGLRDLKNGTAREEDEDRKAFAFTRALANDQRLRYEGAMYADKMARKLFTSDTWDWTPEA